MTQMDSPYNEPHFQQQYGASAAAKPTSGLAITALVMSLILCCPLTTIPAILLGLIAIPGTGPSSPRKGRGLAIAAVLIGLLATAGQVAVVVATYNGAYVPVTQGPGPALESAFNNDIAGFKAAMYGDAAAATDAEVEQFINELQRRYGAYQGATLSPAQQQPMTPGQATGSFDYILHFENGNVNARSEFYFTDPATGGFIFKPAGIVIMDEDLGDIEFPVDDGG